MKPALHHLALPGGMLARGFWLYVWEVTTDAGAPCFYVGRTGDGSSPNAQSPFSRLSQHLGQNPKSNALRRNLARAGVNADECRSFDLIAFGPIFAEESTMILHRPVRDTMAGLEMGLCAAMNAAGYRVLNKVSSRMPVDEERLTQVIRAFAGRFPRLDAHAVAIGLRASETQNSLKWIKN